MDNPLVSVVIPFYSEISWLLEALKSVENQSYDNIEVLLVNDGSKENLQNISDKFNLKIKIINKENGGPSSARNLGINKSIGKYIAFIDSDDIWLPDKLTKQIDYMEKNKCFWSQHSYEMFWNDSKRKKIINTSVYTGNVLKDSYISFRVQTSCCVVLRTFLNDYGIRFPEDIRYGEDGELYRNIAKHASLCYIDGVYSKFRVRGTNAGFNAKVQILDKARTWAKIKGDLEILALLPKPIIFAYKLSSLASKKVIYKINQKEKNGEITDVIAKLLYTFPYILFRIFSKKTNKPL